MGTNPTSTNKATRMKKCPFCAKLLQEKAHHCHHCNSMLIDMDGNALGGPVVQTSPEMEMLEKVMKVFVTIFFTIQFFIDGILILQLVFGISILEMNSGVSVLANIVLLVISVAGALLITPHIIKWAKHNFLRVTK
jgi:hypothetical protein